MKKFIFAITAALAMMASFSSCDEDDRARANVLSGEWEGDFYAYYEYSFDQMPDKWFRAFADYSLLYFTPDHNRAYYGYGYEVDYYTSAVTYNNAPYERFVNKFNWEIRDGRISITFPKDANLDVTIKRYELDNEVFSGYFESGHPFCLYKQSDYYNYSTLGDGDYFYCDTHGYGRENADGNDYYHDDAPARRYVNEEGEELTITVRQGREFNLPDTSK